MQIYKKSVVNTNTTSVYEFYVILEIENEAPRWTDNSLDSEFRLGISLVCVWEGKGLLQNYFKSNFTSNCDQFKISILK